MTPIALRRRRGESGPNLIETALVKGLLLLPALYCVPARPHAFGRSITH